MVVQVQAAQDRFAQSARANQRCERGRSDVDHRARFDASKNRAGSHGQINLPELSTRSEAESNGRLAQRLRYVLQSRGGVSNDGKQPIKKQRGDRGAQTDSKKW